MHRLVRDRMREAKFGRMQGEARGATGVGHSLAVEGAIVDALAAHGVAQLREMDADLMRAARFQAAGKECVTGERFFDGDVRDGFFALTPGPSPRGRGERRAAAPAVAAIAKERRANRLCL